MFKKSASAAAQSVHQSNDEVGADDESIQLKKEQYRQLEVPFSFFLF